VEILGFVFILWCVYLSDSVWWTARDRLVLRGSQIGQFSAQWGPSLEVRDGKGFALTSVLPPFSHSFECVFHIGEAFAGSAGTDPQIERVATRSLVLAAPLRRLGEGLWIYLFVVVPITIAAAGLLPSWPFLLAILLLWLVAIIVTYRRAWRRLYDGKPTAWKADAVLMVLSPPGAIRAADKLTRFAFASASPVRVLSVVAAPEEFCRLARMMYFDPEVPSSLAIRQEVDIILEGRRLRSVFNMAPTREPGMTGFCRRCHGQVMRSSGNCPDCVDMPITPF
jgi:hypothetical protein